jgi:hypothetical protein
VMGAEIGIAEAAQSCKEHHGADGTVVGTDIM